MSVTAYLPLIGPLLNLLGQFDLGDKSNQDISSINQFWLQNQHALAGQTSAGYNPEAEVQAMLALAKAMLRRIEQVKKLVSLEDELKEIVRLLEESHDVKAIDSGTGSLGE